MKEKEILAGILAEYFTGYKYKDAIMKIKDRLQKDTAFYENWEQVSDFVRNNKLNPEDAFHLVAYVANLPLDYDTDEEAYRWLMLFLENVESNKIIIEY